MARAGGFIAIAPQMTADTSAVYDSSQYKFIVVMANGLAGSEKVNLKVQMQLADGSLVTELVTLSDGSPAILDDTHPSLPLVGGPYYIFDKSTTTAAVGVFVYPNESN